MFIFLSVKNCFSFTTPRICTVRPSRPNFFGLIAGRGELDDRVKAVPPESGQFKSSPRSTFPPRRNYFNTSFDFACAYREPGAGC
jgi:hypothetical protein